MPWAKFFWTDYAADPQLKLCSFAAQGLWMRMLCIAAEHEPAGYVAINGRGLDQVGICRITGGALEEVRDLLAELEQNGVYSRDRRGWIYSRRMINDAKMRRKASEAGKKGGNPRLREQRENSPPLKGKDKATFNGEPKPQKPEARVLDSIVSSNEDKSAGADAPVSKQEILEAWETRMVPIGFPAIRKMTTQRERQLKARLRDSTIEDWQRAMDALERSPFLRGENPRGWRADFDFLLQPKSFTKLIEGYYDH